MGGVWGDRFFRPQNVTFSNSTILRSCLEISEENFCNPIKIANRIWAQIQEQQAFPSNAPGAGGWSPIANSEAYHLINKFLKSEKSILIFTNDSTFPLFLTKKVNALGLSLPSVDERSISMTNRAITMTNDITKGSIIIVENHLETEINKKLISVISSKWQLCPIESMSLVAAYSLQDKKMKCP